MVYVRRSEAEKKNSSWFVLPFTVEYVEKINVKMGGIKSIDSERPMMGDEKRDQDNISTKKKNAVSRGPVNSRQVLYPIYREHGEHDMIYMGAFARDAIRKKKGIKKVTGEGG